MRAESIAAPVAPLQRILVITVLVAAGEAVFLLPFVIARIFRPTFLDVFGISNFELGAAFSLYGLVAVGAYFAGGPLADRFPARRLMAAALLSTAAGGVWMAQIPSLGVLTLLYGFWGLSTILLFWAALIRATRVWGGAEAQGQSYGLLDGGRGLLAAVLASVLVAIFAQLLPETVTEASLVERRQVLSQIIWLNVGFILLVAGLVWACLPEEEPGLAEPGRGRRFQWANVGRVMRMPAVWLQALIVVCAYVGYKSTDDFSLFARDAFGYDEVMAARIGTLSFWMRPVAALAAGWLGDRLGASRVTAGSFALLVAGNLVLALGGGQLAAFWLLLVTISATSVGIYALRGVYFALFEEARVPLGFTGTAAGLVSVVGYTPDIFMGPWMGYLIDRTPGALGHQQVFGTVAVFGLIGLVATWAFRRRR